MEALVSDWLQQLSTGTPDPALTAQLAAKLAGSSSSGDAAAAGRLLTALQMNDPALGYEDAVGALEELEAFSELDGMGEEELQELIRSAPSFDLAFLEASAPPEWAGELVAAAIAQGKHWIQETLNSLYILLTPPQPLGLAAASTRRSLSDNLPYFSLEAERGIGWDVEVETVVESEAAAVCEVRVSVSHPEGVQANVEVTIRYSGTSGDEWESAATDSTGLAVFGGIPLAALDQLVIRVQTSDE